MSEYVNILFEKFILVFEILLGNILLKLSSENELLLILRIFVWILVMYSVGKYFFGFFMIF